MTKDISVIIPLQNEEKNVEIFYFSLKKALDCTNKSYEMIFIDDGSEDNTCQNLYKIYRVDSYVNVIRLDKNYGQTAAIAAGFDFARGGIIFTMDGDLQHDPFDIPKFLEKIYSGYDMVSGWKRKRSDNFLTRKLPALVANRIIGFLFNINLRDIGSTYRAYRKEIIKDIKLYGELHRFIPLLIKKDISICEVEIKHNKRIYGQSHYGLSRIGRVGWDIFLLWIMQRNHKKMSLPKSIYSIKEIKSHP